MNSFYYEQSDPERFQQLCQALIVAEFPNTTCYPVGQRDGGRDALQVVRTNMKSRSVRLFQVKFVREPAKIKDVHAWLESTISGEAPKVQRLIEQGYEVSQYILITNVPGTAYLEAGTMDRANTLLADSLSVPGRMWWRDDLDRRCEARPQVVWAYPEILRATDVFSALADLFSEAYGSSRHMALRNFIVEQHEEDSKVRFQQLELTNDLIKLFIDVPAMFPQKTDSRRQGPLLEAADNVRERVAGNVGSRKNSPIRLYRAPASEEDRVGAAALLLDDTVANLSPFIVLEGGPGQGKSTLGQFICQVYRMKFIGDPQINSLNPHYIPRAAKLPIKVDLREYATWLDGKDPFSEEEGAKRPPGANKSLEGFIAALVSDLSGGVAFSVDDLNLVAHKSSIIMVLDGLDEVGEISLRNRVVQEISSAVRRLKDSAASLQVVVTTRPSALAEVASFPANIFESWSLGSLTRNLIAEYAEKWSQAENLNSREKADLRKVLTGKLDQIHIRELARNPMQLTILLSVIRTRGASLPDKRTTLYDIYVDLFFAREAGKNDDVKEFHDELIDIHRYLAWVLHAEAETGRTLGRIDEARLLEVLRNYLIHEQRDPDLANTLFRGVTQRVVFLVGAVEGQYQFEVQPLREYFAAKFLYEDAPHSSVGNPQPGTIDERFSTIAKNAYWQNVARFYAGCFRKAELPALVERLQELCEDGDLALTAYPRELAATLCADWVFSQNPRSLKSAVELVLSNDGYRSLFGSDVAAASPFILPEGCGRVELIDRCFEVLQNTKHSDVRFRVARLAQTNSPLTERVERWWRQRPGGDLTARAGWLSTGYALGVISECSVSDIVADDDLGEWIDAGLVSTLAGAGRFDVIDADDELTNAYVHAVLSGELEIHSSSITHELALLPSLFSTLAGYDLFRSGFTRLDQSGRMFLGHGVRISEKLTKSRHHRISEIADRFIRFMRNASDEAPGNYFSSWEEMLQPVLDLGTSTDFSIVRVAAFVSVMAPAAQTDPTLSINDESATIFSRFQAARRYRGSIKWWATQLDSSVSFDERFRVLQAAFTICGPRTLGKLLSTASNFLESLSEKSFHRLVQGINRIQYRAHSRSDIMSLELSDRALMMYVRACGFTDGDISTVVKRMENYRGDDSAILNFFLEINPLVYAGMDVLQDSTWNQFFDLTRKAYAQDSAVDDFVIRRLVRAIRSMPIETAREVSGKRDLHPCSVIDLAERRCLQFFASNQRPLLEIANESWWPPNA
jgi:hypothetical protein